MPHCMASLNGSLLLCHYVLPTHTGPTGRGLNASTLRDFQLRDPAVRSQLEGYGSSGASRGFGGASSLSIQQDFIFRFFGMLVQVEG